MTGPYQTGDVYKCSLSKRINGNGCSKLNLGIVLQNTSDFYYSSPTNTVLKCNRGTEVWRMCSDLIFLKANVSKQPGDMCKTEVGLPYQSFHISNGLCTFLRVCFTTYFTACFLIRVAHVMLVRCSLEV